MYTGLSCNNHLEKYEFVNGKDDIPYVMENKKCSKPPTSIYIYICTYTSYIYLYIYIILDIVRDKRMYNVGNSDDIMVIIHGDSVII